MLRRNGPVIKPRSQSWGRKGVYMVGKICEKVGLEPGVKERGNLWMMRVVSWESKKMWQDHEQASQKQRDWNEVDGELGSWFMQRHGEAYLKERSVMRKRGWCWWSSEGNVIWGASVARRLNRDYVMKIRRLGGCGDLISEWEEFVFNAFGYFEPTKRV